MNTCRFAVIAITALAGLCASASADFVFPNFPDATGLTLNGYTSIGGASVLISNGTESGSGSAFYTDAQVLSGPWYTTFTYNLTDGTPPPDFTTGADGIAFVITKNGPTSLGGGGGSIGLNGGFGGAAVMFRSWDNERVDLAASNDNLDPFSADPPLDTNPLGNALIRGLHTVLISYSGGVLSAYMDGSATPVVTAALDLTNFNGQSLLNDDGTAWIGFTGATGLGIDVQQINDWTFVAPAPGAAGFLALGMLSASRRRR